MTRAQETAGIVALELPRSVTRIQDPLFVEGYPCDPEPQIVSSKFIFFYLF